MLPRPTQTGLNNGPGWELLTHEAQNSLKAEDYDNANAEAGASHVPTTSSQAALDTIDHGINAPDRTPRLPLEIIEIIVAFACGIQPGLTSAACTDAKTTLRIALVSKALHRIAQPLLYTCVTLTRPSQLMLYARTIVRRPKLAKLAKTLWIGPDSETLLSPLWWPLNADRSAMRSSLTDPEQLPREVARGKWWPAAVSHEEGGLLDCEKTAEAAVAEVIKGAWQLLGAAIQGPQSCDTCSGVPNERRCPHDEEWRLQAFKVQWLLDEYMHDWRKGQDAALVCGSDSENDELPGGVGPCTIKRDWPDPCKWLLNKRDSDLRPGRGPCDLFDHPVLYERSEDGRFSKAAEEDKFNFESEPSRRTIGFPRYSTLNVLDDVRSQSTPSGMSKLTTAGLLQAAAIILLRMPQLKGLAVTGYTRGALSDTLSVLPRSALRLLALGPMPQPSSGYLDIHDARFPSLEILQLQSDTSDWEIEGIARLGLKLGALRWNFWTPNDLKTEGFLPISGLRTLLTLPRADAGGSGPLQTLRILVSADANNIALFDKYDNDLRDDDRLQVQQIQEGVDLTDWTYASPAFLGREPYHYQALSLMQQQWKEDVEKVLRDDVQLFPPRLFPRQGMGRT